MTENKTNNKGIRTTSDVLDPGKQPRVLVSSQVFNTQVNQNLIPSPQEMVEYKNISPDLPDRIMKMAEKEQESQYSLRMALVKSKDKIEENSYKRDFLSFILKMSSLVFATALCIVFIVYAVHLFIDGHPVTGSLFTAPAFIAILKYMLGINLSDFREKPKDSKK